MKHLFVVLLFGSLAPLLLVFSLFDNPHDKIARAQVFSERLAKAKTIDPEIAPMVDSLIASMEASGEQTDSIWEDRRRTAMQRLESFSSIAMAKHLKPTDISSSNHR